MTATAYVRLYQEGHARSTGYQVTEWVDSSLTSTQLRSPFLMSVMPLETPDEFERVATPIDLETYSATTMGHLELRGGDVDPYALVLTSLGLAGTTEVVIDVGSLPHWDVTTAINTVSYADDANTQVFPISSIEITNQTSGVCVVGTGSLYATGISLTPEDVGAWLYLTGMTTTANNGAAKILSYEGELVRVFRPTGALVNENCPSAQWNRKRISLATTKPFLRKEPRQACIIQRDNGGSPVSVTTSTVSVICPRVESPDFYLTDRITLLFSTLEQATSHMTVVRSYLEALTTDLNAIEENETFGTLGPFDYPE